MRVPDLLPGVSLPVLGWAIADPRRCRPPPVTSRCRSPKLRAGSFFPSLHAVIAPPLVEHHDVKASGMERLTGVAGAS